MSVDVATTRRRTREDDANHAVLSHGVSQHHSVWWHFGTHIARKGVEERAVLIILEAFVDLVLPNHTTIVYEVDKVKEMSTSGAVGDEQDGAL